jgi:hypothetical protein
MKKLTSLELLMEYMEQNQYFIGNDLLAKYNELLQKEKKQQLRIGVVSQQRELLVAFAEWILSSEEDITSEMINKDVNTFLATNFG